MASNSMVSNGTLTFDGTEAEKTVNMPGSVFYLRKTPFPMDLEFQTAEGLVVGRVQGVTSFRMTFPSYARPSQVLMRSDYIQTIRFVVAEGDVDFPELAEGIEARIQQATALADSVATLTGGDRDEVLPADAMRRQVIITADPDNAGLIYPGGPDVDASNGAIILAAGEQHIETGAACAAWYVWADTADDKVRIQVAT